MNGHDAKPKPTLGGAETDDQDLFFDLRSALEEDEGRVGIFPSWKAVYLTVLIYSLITVAILYAFTAALDFSPP